MCGVGTEFSEMMEVNDMRENVNYRIIRTKSNVATTGDELSIQEVYYDDDNTMMAHTIDLEITGNSIPELRDKLQSMLWSLDRDVLDAMADPKMLDFHSNPSSPEDIEKTL